MQVLNCMTEFDHFLTEEAKFFLNRKILTTVSTQPGGMMTGVLYCSLRVERMAHRDGAAEIIAQFCNFLASQSLLYGALENLSEVIGMGNELCLFALPHVPRFTAIQYVKDFPDLCHPEGAIGKLWVPGMKIDAPQLASGRRRAGQRGCECGAAKLGYGPGIGHSRWCPEGGLS